MQQREKLGTRLGFLFVAAACAIGLGNVWRFPFICGEYGGGIFVLIFLICLAIISLPILTMEFAVGRASQKSIAKSFHVLEPEGSKWHIFSYFGIAGNYMLMMFYCVVTGWMMNFLYKYIVGEFSDFRAMGANGEDDLGTAITAFLDMIGDPAQQIIWMVIAVVFGFGVVGLGLKNGVERVTKIMMSCLFILLIILIVRSVTLPGASEGLKFFLLPHTEAFARHTIWEIMHAAMGHAFFTVSVGMGSMAIFGSYIGKDRRLLGESAWITALDTGASIGAGLVIFPACFAFGVEANSGAGLVFMTLPNVFDAMPGGAIWGIMFFLFMSFGALSTVVAVFENLVAYWMDMTTASRQKIVLINLPIMLVACLPTALGFNVLNFIHPLGGDTEFIDLFDFAVSNNILPIGAAIYLLFCVTKKGWGFENFLAEANEGEGLIFPNKFLFYFKYIVPVVIVVILIVGYFQFFN